MGANESRDSRLRIETVTPTALGLSAIYSSLEASHGCPGGGTSLWSSLYGALFAIYYKNPFFAHSFSGRLPPPAPAFSRQEAPILAKRSTFFR